MTAPQQVEPGLPGNFDRPSAQSFCTELADTLDRLIALLERETGLVRAGKLREAASLGEDKTQLSRDYARAHSVMKRSGQELGRLAPVEIDRLRQFNSSFESALAANLAVLATARTVSEGLVRGVAEALAGGSAKAGSYNGEARNNRPGAGTGPIGVDVAL